MAPVNREPTAFHAVCPEAYEDRGAILTGSTTRCLPGFAEPRHASEAVFAQGVDEHREITRLQEVNACPTAPRTRLNSSLLVKAPEAASGLSPGREPVAERGRIDLGSSLGTF